MEEKKYVVYIHINKTTNKTYVGQSCNIERRWRNNGIDYYNYNKSDEDQSIFWKAIQSYGWDGFEHIILKENLTLEEANYWEGYYMDFYHSRYFENGYNIREAGSNGALSEKTKQKLSELAKERELWKGDNNPKHLDPPIGEKNPMYGKKHSEETRQKISEALTGRTLSEEQKQKIANFMNTNHPRAKKVRCIETGEVFLSARKAAEAYGTAHTCITRVCNGERKTTQGKHWEWVTEDDINE